MEERQGTEPYLFSWWLFGFVQRDLFVHSMHLVEVECHL